MNRPIRFPALFILLALVLGCANGTALDRVSSLGELPHSTVQVDDAQLAYRILGQGEPLLMVMGFAGTMDIWDLELVRELAKNNRVILFDNRGMGASSAGSQKPSIARMAADSAGLLEAVGIEKAHVFGWSMGGLIAQELALNHPGKVDRLVLMGTACGSEPVAKITRELLGMSTEELLTHFFPKPWLERNPDAFERLPRPGSPAKPEAVMGQAEAMMDWPGTCDRLKTLDKEVLIISGLQDDILPESLSVEMAQLIKGAWLVRYDNAAHWLLYQGPKSLAHTVSLFLRERVDMLEE